MSNPFAVAVPDAFQALMTGVGAYDRQRKLTKEAENEALYKQIGSQMAAGGGVNPAAVGALASMGPQSAPLLTAIAGFGKADMTDDLKELAAENKSRAARGLPPMQPLEYIRQVKQAGANQSSVNMPPIESAYDAASGKEFAEMNIGIIKGAQSATNKLNSITKIEQLLSDPSVYQGTGGDRVLQAKRLAKSIGWDVGDVGGSEAVQAISNQLALEARNPAGGAGMPGAMSDADREFLRGMQPDLHKTPEGNRQIIEINRKLNQRAIEVEKLRQAYVKQNKRLNEGFFPALAQWAEANPLFPAAARPPVSPGAAGAPRPAPAGLPPPPAGFVPVQ